MFQQFTLLKDLEQDQIDTILAQNDLYKNVTPSDISNLPEVNPNNFVNICNFVDYYQLIYDNEFLENIRYHILNKNQDIIDQIKKLSQPMQDKIYDHECIPEIKCCYYNIYFHNHTVKHIACYKYFSQKMDTYNVIECSSGDGNLEFIEYLFKIGKKTTSNAVIYASSHGHLDVVKYLIEVQHINGTPQAINRASGGGHLDVVKYLFEVQHIDCDPNTINYATENGHLDVIKYLFEVAHKNCDDEAISHAGKNGHLEVVKYLIEKQNKKYTQLTKRWAKKNVLEYLQTKPDSFI